MVGAEAKMKGATLEAKMKAEVAEPPWWWRCGRSTKRCPCGLG
jgi:hypothetical protein